MREGNPEIWLKRALEQLVHRETKAANLRVAALLLVECDHSSATELPVADIAATLDMSQPNVSRALTSLAELGLWDVEREGRSKTYRLRKLSLDRSLSAASARQHSGRKPRRR